MTIYRSPNGDKYFDVKHDHVVDLSTGVKLDPFVFKGACNSVPDIGQDMFFAVDGKVVKRRWLGSAYHFLLLKTGNVFGDVLNSKASLFGPLAPIAGFEPGYLRTDVGMFYEDKLDGLVMDEFEYMRFCKLDRQQPFYYDGSEDSLPEGIDIIEGEAIINLRDVIPVGSFILKSDTGEFTVLTHAQLVSGYRSL